MEQFYGNCVNTCSTQCVRRHVIHFDLDIFQNVRTYTFYILNRERELQWEKFANETVYRFDIYIFISIANENQTKLTEEKTKEKYGKRIER